MIVLFMFNAFRLDAFANGIKFLSISNVYAWALATILFISGSLVQAEPSNVEIIVNSQGSLDVISLRDLRAIYSMKRTYWSDDNDITVYVLNADDTLHRAFCKKRLNVFPRQLESIWYRQVYTGTGSAPIALSSADMMVEHVANTPGAIGYIDEENLQKIKNNENIKILRIN